jgi:hypothetical protein
LKSEGKKSRDYEHLGRPSPRCAANGIFELTPLVQLNKRNTLFQNLQQAKQRFSGRDFCHPKMQRGKPASSPRKSRPVSKDEPDPREIHHRR